MDHRSLDRFAVTFAYYNAPSGTTDNRVARAWLDDWILTHINQVHSMLDHVQLPCPITFRLNLQTIYIATFNLLKPSSDLSVLFSPSSFNVTPASKMIKLPSSKVRAKVQCACFSLTAYSRRNIPMSLGESLARKCCLALRTGVHFRHLKT